MQFFPPPQSPYSPSAYDPPFTPRYSVPESFRRALSYEGQLHWLGGLYESLSGYVDSMHSFWIVDNVGTSTRKDADALVGTDHEFEIQWTTSLDKDVWSNATIKAGDVCAIRFVDSTDGRICFWLGVLKQACRCIEKTERWLVSVEYVVHDLTAVLDALTARVDVLETRVDDHESRIKTLETKVANHETRITVLENKATDHETRITNLENRMTVAETNITNLGNRLTSVEGDVTKLKTDVTNLTTKVTNLEKSAGTDSTARANADKANTSIADILTKIFGGGTVGADGHITWPTTDKIAIGNMNLYGGNSNAIKTRTGTVASGSDNDVRVV